MVSALFVPQITVDWLNNGGDGADGIMRGLAVVDTASLYYDVTPYVRRASLTWGKSLARELEKARSGTLTLLLDNSSRFFSLFNANSQLWGFMTPGRPVEFWVNTVGFRVGLFHGRMTDYDNSPRALEKSATFTVNDEFNAMSVARVSTPLYANITTGQAVGYMLDAYGWTGARAIDPGVVTMPYWWTDGGGGDPANGIIGETFLDALRKLEDTELGFAYIDGTGTFRFEDRNHRTTATRSTTVQATYSAAPGAEPVFLDDGFQLTFTNKDVYNRAHAVWPSWTIQPAATLWDYTPTPAVAIAPGATYVVYAGDPVAWANPLLNGSMTVAITPGSLTYTWTDGHPYATHGILNITNPTGSTVNLTHVVLTGQTVQQGTVAQNSKVGDEADNPDSQALYGLRPYASGSPAWLGNQTDAQNWSLTVVAKYKDPRPRVTFKVRAGRDAGPQARLTQMAISLISDRIHIVEPQTGINDDYWIEAISLETEKGMADTIWTLTIQAEKCL